MYCSAQIGLVLDHLKFKLTTQNNRQDLITKLYKSEFELYIIRAPNETIGFYSWQPYIPVQTNESLPK